MFLLGFKFLVLNPVFLSHLGMEFSKNYSEDRKEQLRINHVKYRQFFKDMKRKYGKDPFHKGAEGEED